MIKYLVWLQLALGAGNQRARSALEFFHSAENIYNANFKTRVSSKLFTKGELEKLAQTKIAEAEEIIAVCKREDIQIIGITDEKYPYCLSVIENPPIVLYVKGKLPVFDTVPTVCIVGPRRVSEFGKKASFSLSYRLAAAGFIVVSGGALGTDTFAHSGTLRADGITVACLGCGILNDYLSENKALRDAISKKGCLISEYPPYTAANRYTFPVRNRIMSALSLGTVVVEAGQKSGALITARHAYEQGRDVFVIPGSPNKKEYAGSNLLLRDGAKPILDASDIFGEYVERFADKINIEKAYQKPIISPKNEKSEKNNQKNEKNSNQTLSNGAKIVYNCIDKQKFFPEEIKNTGLDSATLLSALTELEMEMLIRALPGGMYEKCEL